LDDRSERLDRRLATLRSVSRILARRLDLVDILRFLHAEVARLLDAPIGFFGVYDAPGQTVEVVWQIHDGRELPGGHFPLGSGPTSQAIRSGQPRLIRCWSRECPPVQVQYATDRPGLPESAITVPVVFDEQVVGVLSIQSYQPEVYDEDDLALVQGIADQAAVAIAAAQHGFEGATTSTSPPRNASELEAILASMSDALLVLDDQGRLVRLNQAARRLLCLSDGTLILGYPVDRPQGGHWPLGTQALTRQLQPIIDQLRQGEAPTEEVEVALDGAVSRPVGCKASVLLKEGAPAGGVMVLREIRASRAA
jgi:GAF domain-containing protein